MTPAIVIAVLWLVYGVIHQARDQPIQSLICLAISSVWAAACVIVAHS